jgi:hypothetical protein
MGQVCSSVSASLKHGLVLAPVLTHRRGTPTLATVATRASTSTTILMLLIDFFDFMRVLTSLVMIGYGESSDNDANWRHWKIGMFAADVSLCMVESFEGLLFAVLTVLAVSKGACEALVADFRPMCAHVTMQIP